MAEANERRRNRQPVTLNRNHRATKDTGNVKRLPAP